MHRSPQRHAFDLALCLSLAALASACDQYAPEIGEPLPTDRCIDLDSNPEIDVSFQRDIVDEILSESCFHCHHPEASNAIGIFIGGFDMSSYSSFRSGGLMGGASVIVPNQPCASIIIHKLEGAPFGARMPFDAPPYLDAESLRVLYDWIAEGAKDN